jgi:hypothetical protein
VADIPVNIVAQGNLASETAKAAAGMKLLADREEKVAFAAKSLGISHRDAAKAISAQGAETRKVAQEEAKLASAALKAIKAKELAEKKLHQQEIAAAKGMTKLERAKEGAFKREYGDLKAILSGDIIPLFEGMGMKAALPLAIAGALATALLGAAAAAGVLLGGITALALKAGTARDETKAMLDVLTAGKGDQTLTLLTGLAKDLGVSITDTRDKFIEFRKAGLDNAQSAALIKLKADLQSTGMAAGEADKGIAKIIEQAKKADGSFDGKIFGDAFKLIASQAGVAGDGVAAAAKNARSLGGALASLDNSKTQALEAIYDRIKPKIDEAAQSVAKFVSKFLDSEQGKKALEGISSAISGLLGLIPTAVDWTTKLMTAWSAFSDSTTGKIVLEGLKVTLYAVAAAAGVVLAGVALLMAPLYALGAAGAYVIGILADLGSKAFSLGGNIIQGLINGISGSVGALFSKVSGVASGILKTFKSALGIASPSKPMKAFGKFTGKGAEIGLEESTPGVESAAQDMARGVLSAPQLAAADFSRPGPTSAASPGQAASAPGVASGAGLSFTIENLNVQTSGDPKDVGPDIRQAIDEWYSAKLISRGVPA